MAARIAPIADGEELQAVRQLFQEYADSLDIDLCFQNFAQELAELPGKFAPPAGCLLLATVEGYAAGCVAIRPHQAGICEMKRLYVRPSYRKLGLGRELAERVIQEAHHIGYARMRLDTISPLMDQAIALYRGLGFEEIQPYCHNPFPGALFMELQLTSELLIQTRSVSEGPSDAART